MWSPCSYACMQMMHSPSALARNRSTSDAVNCCVGRFSSAWRPARRCLPIRASRAPPSSSSIERETSCMREPPTSPAPAPRAAPSRTSRPCAQDNKPPTAAPSMAPAANGVHMRRQAAREHLSHTMYGHDGRLWPASGLKEAHPLSKEREVGCEEAKRLGSAKTACKDSSLLQNLILDRHSHR